MKKKTLSKSENSKTKKKSNENHNWFCFVFQKNDDPFYKIFSNFSFFSVSILLTFNGDDDDKVDSFSKIQNFSPKLM